MKQLDLNEGVLYFNESNFRLEIGNINYRLTNFDVHQIIMQTTRLDKTYLVVVV